MAVEKERIEKRLAALEAKLGLPGVAETSKKCVALAEARQNLLGLPDISKASDFAKEVGALSEKYRVVVEYEIKELNTVTDAVSAACCCCCCCR